MSRKVIDLLEERMKRTLVDLSELDFQLPPYQYSYQEYRCRIPKEVLLKMFAKADKKEKK